MKRLVMWCALGIFIGVLLILSGHAQACCIYNDTIHPLEVQSDIAGMDEWIVHPSNHRCTRGTGGKDVHLWLLDPFEHYLISTTGTIWVADHGWISAHKKQGGRWRVVSHNADGSEHATIYLQPKND